ncbi:MAG: hypothetical protein M3458_19520 [Acidobacteriota bacterium]|nr:hypothetical protein [Acidobacteriota bacterium]
MVTIFFAIISGNSLSSSGIDLNGGAGNDNAEIDKGGKRGVSSTGTPSVMWKAVSGYTTSVAADGLTAISDVKTSGADKGKTRITFSTSAIGGDNYYLVAQLKRDDGSLLLEKKSGKWAVWKRLSFGSVYRMDGGVDVGSIMSVANINPAFNGNGYTEYSLGTVGSLVAGATSPEFASLLIVPSATETPTAQELTDYAGTDLAKKTAAEASITTKAQAWYNRNLTERDAAYRSLIAAIGATAPAVIGARYAHPKMDSNTATGQSFNYPDGIKITLNDGATKVDADGEWQQVQGAEIDDVAFMFLNVTSPNRRVIVGRHEAGHASDHVQFGSGSDHATERLMHPTSDQLKYPPDGTGVFSDNSILRLRGWR